MKEIEAIKQALAAGPTPGPWHADNKFGIGPTSTDDDQSFGFVIPCAEVSGENIENNARYIAVCNPAAMQAIIDHIDEQAAEIERLRAKVETLAWAVKDAFASLERGLESDALSTMREAMKEAL